MLIMGPFATSKQQASKQFFYKDAKLTGSWVGYDVVWVGSPEGTMDSLLLLFAFLTV